MIDVPIKEYKALIKGLKDVWENDSHNLGVDIVEHEDMMHLTITSKSRKVFKKIRSYFKGDLERDLAHINIVGGKVIIDTIKCGSFVRVKIKEGRHDYSSYLLQPMLKEG